MSYYDDEYEAECICDYVDVLGPGYPLMRIQNICCVKCNGEEFKDGPLDPDPGFREDEPPADMYVTLDKEMS